MAYSDKHHLEKKEAAWDGDMSHEPLDATDSFAPKQSSTDAMLDGDAKIASLVSASGGLVGSRSVAKKPAKTTGVAHEHADAGEGFAQSGEDRDFILTDNPLLLNAATDGQSLFVHADTMAHQTLLLASDDIQDELSSQAERMGGLRRAMKNYGAQQPTHDPELIDESERDAGGQVYAHGKHSFRAPVHASKERGKRIANKPSTRRQMRAINRSEAKLARFAKKTEVRKRAKTWGQSKWYQGYSKLRTKRLKRRVQKAQLMLKPSRWRWLIGLISSMGIFILIMLLAVVSIAIIGGIGGANNSGGKSLSTSERQVYVYLKQAGLDDIHTAAIMGNIRAESGGECGDEFDTGAVEDGGSGGGHGLCQWTGGRWDGYGGLLEFAEAQDKSWTDIGVQLDFFWTEYAEQWAGGFTITQGDSPPAGTYVEGTKSGFEDATEVGDATRQFCYGWERPGIPHESTRVRFSHWYLRASTGTDSYSDLLSAAFSIADNATPYVYAGSDIMGGCDCSYFTQWCYAQVGIDIPRQSEQQLFAGKRFPLSEARPGDILWRYGHVGIYVDTETAVEQTPPYCRITPITYEDWEYAVRFD